MFRICIKQKIMKAFRIYQFSSLCTMVRYKGDSPTNFYNAALKQDIWEPFLSCMQIKVLKKICFLFIFRIAIWLGEGGGSTFWSLLHRVSCFHKILCSGALKKLNWKICSFQCLGCYRVWMTNKILQNFTVLLIVENLWLK